MPTLARGRHVCRAARHSMRPRAMHTAGLAYQASLSRCVRACGRLRKSCHLHAHMPARTAAERALVP